MNKKELFTDLVNLEQVEPKAVRETGETSNFLSFPLGSETLGLLPLERLVEVIKVRPQEILPIPEVPEYLLGITNIRGEAVWIVDLLYLMGATHLSRRELIPQMFMAILIQAEEQAIGLLVEQINSLEMYNFQNLQSFSVQNLPPKILGFLEGYFLDAKGNTLALLNVDNIIEKVENFDR